MKVRYVQFVDPRPGTPGNPARQPGLTIGTTYEVLEITVDPQGQVLLRLLGDEGRTPALYDLKQFEIVSSKLPASWIVSMSAAGGLVFRPAAWAAPGFWESYFNGDDAAIRSFKQEMPKLAD